MKGGRDDHVVRIDHGDIVHGDGHLGSAHVIECMACDVEGEEYHDHAHNEGQGEEGDLQPARLGFG